MKKIFERIKNIITLKLLKNITLLFAVVVFIYFLFTILIMPLYTRHWQGVNVPNVAFMSIGAAEKIMADIDLKAVVAAEKYEKNYPPGFVVFQNPEAGSLVKNGRRIYLTIGKGKQQIPVPGLIGLSLRDARFIIDQSNLKLGSVTYEVDSIFHAGTVSSQSVDSLVNVPVGRIIDLIMSLGYEPSEFIVPELIGKSETDARLAIKRAGLILGALSYQPTDKLVPKTVLYQSIESGLTVGRGDTLNIVVSRLAGPDEEDLW
jgi:eukaryotic-like serine/threonine-protein kinase